jgi:hypothetical protein
MGYVVKGMRLLVVLTFLVGMPVLALPPVADWCERQIYRDSPPSDFNSDPEKTVTALQQPELFTPEVRAGFKAPAEPPVEQESMDALLAELRSLGVDDYQLDEVAGEPPHYRLVAEFRSDGPLPERWQYSAVGEKPQFAVREAIRRILADREAR